VIWTDRPLSFAVFAVTGPMQATFSFSIHLRSPIRFFYEHLHEVADCGRTRESHHVDVALSSRALISPLLPSGFTVR